MGSKAGGVVGCAICFLVIGAVVGGILLASAPGQEIPMWFGVTLCKTASGEWVSYDTTDTVCPAAACTSPNDLCTAADASPQSFTIDESMVSKDMDYSPVVMRTDGTAAIDFTVTDANNNLLYQTDGDKSLSSVQAGSPTMVVLGAVEDDEDANVVSSGKSTSRHLLKGSSSGGSSGSSSSGGSSRGSTSRSGSTMSGASTSRSRSGTSASWGTSTPKKTSYGRSARNSVNAATVVVIYRRGPRSSRTRDNYDDEANCENKAKGCQYTLPSNMNRDEFKKEGNPAPIRKEAVYPLTMTVNNLTVSALPASITSSPLRQKRADSATEPELYMTLHSEDQPALQSAGGVILGVSIALIFVVICAFQIYKKRSG